MRYNDMENLIQFSKALADPTRVRILAAIRLGGECLCVCEMVDALDLSQSTLSTHLRVLRNAGLVLATRRQTWVEYRLSPEFEGVIEALLDAFDTYQSDRIQQDALRLRERIAMRVDGCCVVGLERTQIGGNHERKQMRVLH